MFFEVLLCIIPRICACLDVRISELLAMHIVTHDYVGCCCAIFSVGVELCLDFVVFSVVLGCFRDVLYFWVL